VTGKRQSRRTGKIQQYGELRISCAHQPLTIRTPDAQILKSNIRRNKRQARDPAFAEAQRRKAAEDRIRRQAEEEGWLQEELDEALAGKGVNICSIVYLINARSVCG
jgi:hypothetical protein